jgi:hypothetical protein
VVVAIVVGVVVVLGVFVIGRRRRPPAQSSSLFTHPDHRKPALNINGVRLLMPEPILAERLGDAGAMAAAFKAVQVEITRYELAHPDVVPDEFDLAFVGRPAAQRIWLVGPDGDLEVPPLAQILATAVPRVPVTAGSVAAIITFVRVNAEPTPRGPYLPASWKAAAPPGGAEIEAVIDAAWPPT